VQSRLDALDQEQPVGEPRQRIVKRKLLDLAFGDFALGDVRIDGEDRARMTLGVAHRRPTRFDAHERAVFATMRDLAIPKSIGYDVGGRIAHARRIVEEKFRERRPDGNLARPAVKPFGAFIPERDPAVDAANDDRVARPVEPRRLIEDPRARHLALQFHRRPRRKNFQRGYGEIGLSVNDGPAVTR